MGLLSIITGSTVATAGAATLVATASDASGGIDIWTLMEKGGAPMAAGLLLLLFEVTRRHDRAYKIIEAKDATILEMAKRSISAIETGNEIASDQVKSAHNTETVMRELVTLLRGKLDIG